MTPAIMTPADSARSPAEAAAPETERRVSLRRPIALLTAILGRERLSGQIVRFVVVGGLNTLIDYGTFNLLVVAFGMHPVAANPISVGVAIVNSFLWNKQWTFGAGGWHRWYRQAVLFGVVSVAGLLINTGCLWLLNWLTGANSVLALNLEKLGASVVSLTWNFIGYRFLVFRAPATRT